LETVDGHWGRLDSGSRYSKFFDDLSHEHLRGYLQHRVRDGVLKKLIHKWLKAGVMEDGSPQGGVISPILSNVFLHYVLDVWFEQEVKPRPAGTVPGHQAKAAWRRAPSYIPRLNPRNPLRAWLKRLPIFDLGLKDEPLSPEKMTSVFLSIPSSFNIASISPISESKRVTMAA
jgi:hypothetical protein